MMNGRRRAYASILFLLFGTVLLGGCSVFKGSRTLDMSPFRENSAVLFAEASKVNRPFQYKYIGPYLSRTSIDDFRPRTRVLLNAIRGILQYSVQVVAINDANLSQTEKNEQLARYLDEALRKTTSPAMLDSLGLDAAAVQGVLNGVRGAKTYLDGLDRARPIISAIISALQDGLDALQQEHIPSLAAEIGRAIEADYGTMRKNYIDLRDLQARTTAGLILLYRGRIGDRGALATLLSEDPSIRAFFDSADKASPERMTDAEDYLFGRLNRIETMLEQLETEAAEYRAKQSELAEWRLDIDEKVRIARNAILFWAQSHRNLGAGVPVKPLIDVSSVAGSLVNTAKEAAF